MEPEHEKARLRQLRETRSSMSWFISTSAICLVLGIAAAVVRSWGFAALGVAAAAFGLLTVYRQVRYAEKLETRGNRAEGSP